MTSNQRLILAVGLSFVFFIAYTAIFPPPPPKNDTNQTTTQYVAAEQSTKNVPTKQASIKQTADLSGHDIASDESVATSKTSSLVDIHSDSFDLTIDTLGRISSKTLKNDKFHDKEGNRAQMIPAIGVKPLYIRFADEALNTQASQVPYTASVKEIDLNTNEKVSLVLTQ